ncbi:MAG: hypothetical protein PHY42_07010 [Bacilli bacterium]|nr:hypothetical protein [Bacilli bacterium]
MRTGALTSDGYLFAWVYNRNGALVDGTTQTQYSPVMALFDSFAIDKVVSPIANEAIDYVPIIEGIPLMVSIKITN